MYGGDELFGISDPDGWVGCSKRQMFREGARAPSRGAPLSLHEAVSGVTAAIGTSETNGFDQFESAIGVRPDVGPPAAQG
jgi:hypothetical protein